MEMSWVAMLRGALRGALSPPGTRRWFFLLVLRLAALTLTRGPWRGPAHDLVCAWAGPAPPTPPPALRRLCAAICYNRLLPPPMGALWRLSLLLGLLPLPLRRLLHPPGGGDNMAANMAARHNNTAARHHDTAAGDANVAVESTNMAARCAAHNGEGEDNMAAQPHPTPESNMAARPRPALESNMAARPRPALESNMAARPRPTPESNMAARPRPAPESKMAGGRGRAWLGAGLAAMLALGEGLVLWAVLWRQLPAVSAAPIGCPRGPAPCPALACALPARGDKMAALMGVAASAAASLLVGGATAIMAATRALGGRDLSRAAILGGPRAGGGTHDPVDP